MGVYIYRLSTKTRRVSIRGCLKQVHPLNYSHKLSYNWSPSRADRARDAALTRLQGIWERREAPEYVVWGGFEEGNAVYTNWPQGVVERDDATSTSDLIMVGKLRVNGKKLELEPWDHRDLPYSVVTAELQEQMQGLFKGNWFIQVITYGHEKVNRLYSNNPDNFMAAKLLFN